MFYQGDLASGIQSALRQSKSVVCFVRDDGEESSKWEEEYLTETRLPALLSEKAVVLRLVKGTQEAKYLSDMTPITSYPTVVVISNGALKEYVTPGVSKEVFISRLSVAIGGSTAPLSPQSHATETASPLSPNQEITMTVEEENPDGSHTVVSESAVSSAAAHGIVQEMDADPSFIRNESPETERIALAAANAHRNRQIIAPADHPSDHDDSLYDDGQPSPPVAQVPSDLERILAERRAREAARKAAHDEAEKTKRSAAAARRKADMDSAGPSNDPKRAAETKYALEAKKKRQQEKSERERILKQIEDNRGEQKARQEEAKLAREAAQQKIAAHPARASGSGSSPAVRRGDTCALQIRLFDGSTIRRTFESKMTLGKEVREWIDKEQQIAGSPYTFKQILAPQPSKSISAGEEEESLQELGLVPNATLVLVPIRSYTEAYEAGSGVTGVVTGAASAGLGLVGQAAGLLGSGLGWGARALGSVLGGTPANPPPPGPSANTERSDESRNTGGEGNQFYNGNSTNFEPRRKDDDDSRKRD